MNQLYSTNWQVKISHCIHRGFFAEVIVHIFAHLHMALRTEGNMLDMN